MKFTATFGNIRKGTRDAWQIYKSYSCTSTTWSIVCLGMRGKWERQMQWAEMTHTMYRFVPLFLRYNLSSTVEFRMWHRIVHWEAVQNLSSISTSLRHALQMETDLLMRTNEISGLFLCILRTFTDVCIDNKTIDAI